MNGIQKYISPMKNILIVEDEIELAQNIQDLLEHLGFRVIGIFDNAKEVLGYLKTQKPDLILMDIQIKGDMDGIELCQQVKLKYDVPVVYLTAFSDISYLDRIAANKYEGYLLKPFTVDELRSAVHLALSGKNKLKSKSEKSIISIKDKGFTVPLSINDILFFQADGLYTKIQTKTKSYVVRDILKDLIEPLPAAKFVRVHKSFVVNYSEIGSFNSKELHIQDYVIPIRRGMYKDIKKLLGG